MNPYKIPEPSIISFSGGRTSGYMLYKILEAYNGVLPKDIYVAFANTGKEAPETLDFVKDISDKWDIKIHWLEHYFGKEKPIHRTKEVTYETASRNGEPFERLLEQRGKLPNAVNRFCSSELKIKVLYRFMQSKGYKTWDNILGLRYDEPRRAISARNVDYQKWTNLVPLYKAKVTKKDIYNFWNKQNFDLNLSNLNGKTPAGNCDLCFLKGKKTLTSLLKERPEMADWWIKQEEKFNSEKHIEHKTNRFIKGMSYIELVDLSKTNKDLFDDEQMTCFCHD
jgi:3'-phosphoadenosine 5'-phosphosulfate sulfotransferase (PAPS reductase)/FAD synthetase